MSSQSYVMASQPSPSLNANLPFISSPDSANVTPTATSAPPTSNTSSRHESRPSYYPPAIKAECNTKQSEFDLNSLSASTHASGESGREHDSSQIHSKPVLETDGVVSSEVGDVPGILHQDLHPDGQPRRPMNAFMIFARHRRPAIQSKEPGLKTGEISKRLSHDWKNLPEEDKSHYLEQAKLLKDEFHSRFPEYVYKRRPNNTGKRRSSTSQQQLHAKYGCGSGSLQPMHGPMNGGMPHPGDVHGHHYHHLHPPHGDLYSSSHAHHLPPHHHMQPPSRPLSSIAQHSPKLGTFYPPPANPSSPRYHSNGQPTSGSNCGTLVPRHQGPYTSRGPPPPTSSAATVAPSAIHSPRPSSPASSSPASNGLSYMRVSNPHAMAYPAPPSSNHYSWFPNETSYGSSSGHHVSQAQVPLSASRPSFHYSSWPPSVTTDTHSISSSGLDVPDGSDTTQGITHNRAASYSAGPPIYRPPSPVDRGRQLSLPSHSLSSSATETSPNGPSESGSFYPGRSHSDPHSSPPGGIPTANHHYNTYPSPDILNNGSRPAYGATSVTSSFGPAVRNGLLTTVNNSHANSEAHAGFEPHRSPNMHHSNNHLTPGSSSKNDFANHCSPLHHPAPPQPSSVPSTNHHHQHSSGNQAPVTSATSVAY